MNIQTLQHKAELEKVNVSYVFKEYVHVIILDYLFRKNLFTDLVFQGGTALRLVYQGTRYSEDLDFVLKRKNAGCFTDFFSSLQSLPAHIRKFHPSLVVNAEIKIQKETSSFKRYCLILGTTFSGAKDKTNIEVANIPSYQPTTMILRHPDLSLSPAICVESPSEIFSDKLLAFCARDYLKGRDLWDIYFLQETLKIILDRNILDMLRRKVSDYGLDAAVVREKFAKSCRALEEQGPEILKEEMDRFLPLAYREMFADRYPDVCRNILQTVQAVCKELES